VYLFWLRNNSTQKVIARLFSLPSQDHVSRICSSVRNSLKKFIEKYIGVGQMDRNEWLTHNNIYAKEFFFSSKDSGITSYVLENYLY